MFEGPQSKSSVSEISAAKIPVSKSPASEGLMPARPSGAWLSRDESTRGEADKARQYDEAICAGAMRDGLACGWSYV